MKISFVKKLTWTLIVGTLTVSFLPNIFSKYWLIDIFSNFKLQYLVLTIVLLFVSAILFKNKALPISLIVLAIFWNSYYIIPYYIKPDTTEVVIKKKILISSINLLSSNSRVDLVTDYIREEDPDILILMEFTPNWEIELLPLLEKYPYQQLVPRVDNFGIALLSKFKMNSSIEYFELNNKPSIIGNLEIENKKISIVATHPIPPISQTTFENRNKQLSNIISRRSQFSDNLIIAGDFNTSSFSNHFDILVAGDLKDSRIGFGLLPTWPASFKIFQTTLDHFLVSKNLSILKRSTGKNIGSDHLPINIILGLN